MEEVWSVITDYEKFGDVCTCLHAHNISHQPDGDCLIEGRAKSGLPGSVAFCAQLHHERRLDSYISSWDEPAGSVQVNRGRWELTPVGRHETVAVLCLEVQMRSLPTFVLRNLSMARLPEVLRGLERRLRLGSAGTGWSDGS
jgi:hypothetical protein